MDGRLVQRIIDGLGLGWACLCMAYQLLFREGLVERSGCVSFGVNADCEGFDWFLLVNESSLFLANLCQSIG